MPKSKVPKTSVKPKSKPAAKIKKPSTPKKLG